MVTIILKDGQGIRQVAENIYEIVEDKNNETICLETATVTITRRLE